jgi:hypothetical protein
MGLVHYLPCLKKVYEIETTGYGLGNLLVCREGGMGVGGYTGLLFCRWVHLIIRYGYTGRKNGLPYSLAGLIVS